MGRTISSFRISSREEENEWKQFRSLINKSDRKIFDRIFSMAYLYTSASSYAVKSVRIQPIFMSIIFHHYKLLTDYTEYRDQNEENSDNILITKE